MEGGGIEIDETCDPKKISLSMLFNWYKDDFEQETPGASDQLAYYSVLR